MSTATARRLFGTDGMRGIAGEAPLDRTTVYATGLAIGHSLRSAAATPAVIVGRDTRESSPWIAATLAAGLREGGARVESAGIIPTPAVAFLARKHGFHAGVVISASHNPWQDNGIKVFGHDGYKLPDEQELEIEDEIFRRLADPSFSSHKSTKRLPAHANHRHDYEAFLRQVVPSLNLNGKSVVLDCANGAASAIAP